MYIHYTDYTVYNSDIILTTVINERTPHWIHVISSNFITIIGIAGSSGPVKNSLSQHTPHTRCTIQHSLPLARFFIMEQWVCGGMGGMGGMGDQATVARGCIEKEDEEETTKRGGGKMER